MTSADTPGEGTWRVRVPDDSSCAEITDTQGRTFATVSETTGDAASAPARALKRATLMHAAPELRRACEEARAIVADTLEMHLRSHTIAHDGEPRINDPDDARYANHLIAILASMDSAIARSRAPLPPPSPHSNLTHMPHRHELFDRAAALAAEAHEGDIRKGTPTPAIAHPIAVALTLATAGYHENVIVAGLLHDVVEDSDTSFETIRTEFGKDTASLVARCTEPDAPGLRWRDRKRVALAHALHAAREARAIMAADKAQNLRSIASLIERDGEEGAWRALGTARRRQEPLYRALARILKDESGEPFESLRSAIAHVFGATPASDAIETDTQRWIEEAHTTPLDPQDRRP